MLKTIKGTYSNGTIELLEMPTEIQGQADVLVTFFVQEIFDRNNALAESLHDPKWAATVELSALLQEIQNKFPLQDKYIIHFEQFPQRSVGEAFEELRQLCIEEEYTLEIPPRQNRPNAFVEALEEENK